MPSPITRLNTASKEYTGNTVLPADEGRGYLFIVMKGTAGTVSFGGGDGKIPLTATGFYEPLVAPIGAVSIETTGTFVVHEG